MSHDQSTNNSTSKGKFHFNTLLTAIIGTAVVVGIIIGVTFSSVASLTGENVANRTYIVCF